MNDGVAVEYRPLLVWLTTRFDTPLRLYDSQGVFSSLCERSGISREDILNAAKDI